MDRENPFQRVESGSELSEKHYMQREKGRKKKACNERKRGIGYDRKEHKKSEMLCLPTATIFNTYAQKSITGGSRRESINSA